MWPYIALVIAIFSLQLFCRDKKYELQFYTAGIVILFLFAALRGNGSGDYFTYLERIEKVTSWGEVWRINSTGMEPGYNFLAYLVRMFRLPPQTVIIAMNAISLSCLYVVIKRYSPNYLISLIVFLPLFFQFDMHAARTAVAMSISVAALPYALEKKFFHFTVMAVLACLFHRLALISVFLILLPYIHLSFRTGSIMILAGMLIKSRVNLDRIALWGIRALNLDSIAYRYESYVNNPKYGYAFSLLDPRLLLLIGIYILSYFILKERTKLENLLVNCCLFDIFLYIVFSDHTFIAYRIGAFYNMYTVLLVPCILEKSAHKRLGTVGINLVFAAYVMGILCMGVMSSGVDYRFFWMNG